MCAANNDPEELLRKILVQEQKLGYKDTAVIGGIDSFVKEWSISQRRIHPEDSSQVDTLEYTLQNYRISSIRKRKLRVDSALKVLRGESITPVSPSWSVNPNFSSHRVKKNTITRRAAAPSQGSDTDSRKYSRRIKASNKKYWIWIGIAVVSALVYVRSRAANMPPKDPLLMVFQIALSIGLIYFIYRQSTDPYESKPGEFGYGMHGVRLPARYLEKSDRRGCLVWLWIMLISVLASIVQN